MILTTEIRTNQLPQLFDKFEKQVGRKLWEKRAHQVHAEIRGNPFLAELLRRENRLALTLTQFSKLKERYGVLPPIDVSSANEYEAFAFISNTLSMLEHLGKAHAAAFLGRVRGCFGNPRDLLALEFELYTATHLLLRGVSIALPELSERPSCDWTASLGDLAFDVECKVISQDKGRHVHRRDALDIHHLLKKEVGKIVGRLAGGLLVRIVVPDLCPSGHKAKARIVADVRQALLQGAGVDGEEVSITLQDFDIDSSPIWADKPDEGEIRRFLKERFAVDNQESLIIYHPRKRAAVFSIASLKPNRTLEETIGVMNDAAKRQLSPTRAGVICVKFDGITAEELRDIGTEDGSPSALRIHASGFLDDPANRHVVSIAFIADAPLPIHDSETITRTGAVYSFVNSNSPYHDGRFALFNDRG